MKTISEIARQLGKLGGDKTKATHEPDYYKKIRALRTTWKRNKAGATPS